MQTKLSRRTFLKVSGGTVLATTLTGCFGVGNSQTTTGGGGSSSTVSIWDIRTGGEQRVVQAAALPRRVDAVVISTQHAETVTNDEQIVERALSGARAHSP